VEKNGIKNWLVNTVIVFLPPASKNRGEFFTKQIEIHAKSWKKI
jgi:hypothetical protein